MRECDWVSPERPAFDPKRVFNDHRDAALGAYVAINGEPENDDDGYPHISKADQDKYKRMYHDMAAVLQIVVREANVMPGIYGSSFFGDFKRLGNADDYTSTRELVEEITGKPYSRKRYLEASRRSAERDRSKEQAASDET